MGLAWTGRTRICVLEGGVIQRLTAVDLTPDVWKQRFEPEASARRDEILSRIAGSRPSPPHEATSSGGRGSQDGYRSGESRSRVAFQRTLGGVRAASDSRQHNPDRDRLPVTSRSWRTTMILRLRLAAADWAASQPGRDASCASRGLA